MLYALGRHLGGPFLEIGFWVGLSTTAIAQGIVDSGRRKHFDTIDLNPAPDEFRPWNGGIGFFPSGSEVPLGVCSVELYKNEIEPILLSPGGAAGLLQRNLTELGLDHVVSVKIGDFRTLPPRRYNFVFCDALHDLNEIERNAPELRRFLAPDAILACHDVGENKDYIAALRLKLPLRHAVSVDSLYIAEVG